MIKIKPLSVNEAYRGRRYKSKKYIEYENAVILQLSDQEIPDGDLSLHMTVGVSNKQQDLDNAAKVFIDILQHKYGFNDSRIYQLVMIKDVVKKGDEYIDWYIESY